MFKNFLKHILVLLGLLYANGLLANPPYLSDNPVPVDYQKYEWYFYSSFFSIFNSPNVQAPAIELDWGFAHDQEVWALANLGQNFAGGNGPITVGFEDIQAGYYWRFYNNTKTNFQLGFVPTFTFPTGDPSRTLGFGRYTAKVPLALQKVWGNWTFYGGAGLRFANLPYSTNSPYTGWVLQRDFHQKYGFGGEVFTQGTNKVSQGYTIFNVGYYYNFTPNFNLIASIGSSFFGQSAAQGYFGFTWTI